MALLSWSARNALATLGLFALAAPPGCGEDPDPSVVGSPAPDRIRLGASAAASLSINNQTGVAQDIEGGPYVGGHHDWFRVGTVPAGSWIRLAPARDGYRFRARPSAGGDATEHVVALRDAGDATRAPEDVWVLTSPSDPGTTATIQIDDTGRWAVSGEGLGATGPTDWRARHVVVQLDRRSLCGGGAFAAAAALEWKLFYNGRLTGGNGGPAPMRSGAPSDGDEGASIEFDVPANVEIDTLQLMVTGFVSSGDSSPTCGAPSVFNLH